VKLINSIKWFYLDDESCRRAVLLKVKDRSLSTLLPERLDDYVSEDNPVRVVDVFVDILDLSTMGFERVAAKATGRPSYHPATLLKIYSYGYLNSKVRPRLLKPARRGFAKS
jgi:transposase